MLKKLALAAAAAGAVALVRKRSAGRAEADLWAEATRGARSGSAPAG
ncbi:DLW-39 family protein [Geodermatophilus sp. SYSU D00703]